MRKNNVVIRLNAGGYYGLGHLSRCLSITQKMEAKSFVFVIKTDNENLVLDFIGRTFNKPYNVNFIEDGLSINDELEFILSFYSPSDLLIIDHYEANIEYQLKLFNNRVKWLQLDSHAKTEFFANWVLHGSPGATVELYEPLRKNNKTKFLLGPKFCIVKEQVLKLRSTRKLKTSLQKVIICFGGGDDRGALLKCIKNIDFKTFENIKFFVSVSSLSRDYDEIVRYKDLGLINIIDSEDLSDIMSISDLAIISPGMISYEAAFLGLPMLLITIANNQEINAKAWEENGCSINLGNVNEGNTKVNEVLCFLQKHPFKLKEMSMKCLNLVDGRGVERIVNQLMENK